MEFDSCPTLTPSNSFIWGTSLGVDSSYHVRTNVSVRRGIIWDISVHNIHKGVALFFFGVTFKKPTFTKRDPAILRDNLTIDVMVPFNTHFHWLLLYDNNPRWLPSPFLLRFAFAFLVFTHEALDGSWAPLSFLKRLRLRYCALVYIRFDVIVELHAMNEKNVQWHSHWKVKVVFVYNKGPI
jgi:hypothetical protein